MKNLANVTIAVLSYKRYREHGQFSMDFDGVVEDALTSALQRHLNDQKSVKNDHVG